MDINSPEVKDWLTLTAAYIRAEVTKRGITQDQMTPELMTELVLSAHHKIEALVAEMLDGKTQRSKIARDAISLGTYVEITQREGINDIIRKYSN